MNPPIDQRKSFLPLRRLICLSGMTILISLATNAQSLLAEAAVCPIVVVNKSENTETFYLTNLGQTIDSITVHADSTGCIPINGNQSLWQLDLRNARSRLLFFKDKDKPVRITYLKKQLFSVEGSRLDSMWNFSITYQDSLFNIVNNCESKSSRDAKFMSEKENYENWSFREFRFLLEHDTVLAIRFLNYHIRNLRSMVLTNPLYMDSLVFLVYKLSPPRKELLEVLTDLTRVRLNADFYHFDFITTPGDTINTADFFAGHSGKNILIDFWASWCKPCRKKNQQLKNNYAQLQTRNIQILGISLDENPLAWQYALEEDELPWFQGRNLYEHRQKIRKMYNCYAIPLSFLVSPEGRLMVVNPSLEDLLNYLN